MKLPPSNVDNNEDNNGELTNGDSNGHSQPQNEAAINTVPNSIHDVALQSAIDAMFRSREETYQQFLHSFSHLTVGKEISYLSPRISFPCLKRLSCELRFCRILYQHPPPPPRIRVATAQGKQGIWRSIFPDRENTGKLPKNMFLHREFNSNTGKI